MLLRISARLYRGAEKLSSRISRYPLRSAAAQLPMFPAAVSGPLPPLFPPSLFGRAVSNSSVQHVGVALQEATLRTDFMEKPSHERGAGHTPPAPDGAFQAKVEESGGKGGKGQRRKPKPNESSREKKPRRKRDGGDERSPKLPPKKAPVPPQNVSSHVALPAFRVLSREEHDVKLEAIPTYVWRVLREIKKHGYQAYLVGGCVRDLSLGKTPKDFDVLSDAEPREVKRLFPGRSLVVGKRFPICHVRMQNHIVEVSSFSTKDGKHKRTKQKQQEEKEEEQQQERKQHHLLHQQKQWMEMVKEEQGKGARKWDAGELVEPLSLGDTSTSERKEAEAEAGAMASAGLGSVDGRGGEAGGVVGDAAGARFGSVDGVRGGGPEAGGSGDVSSVAPGGNAAGGGGEGGKSSSSSRSVSHSQRDGKGEDARLEVLQLKGKLDDARWQNAMKRDFTINSLFLDPFNGCVYDYLGGLEDLQKGKIRTIAVASTSFDEDPARCMRAIRFAARLGLTLDPSINKALSADPSRVLQMPKSRLMLELNILLSYGAAEKSVWLLWRYRMLDHLLPLQALALSRSRLSRKSKKPEELLGFLSAMDEHFSPDQPCPQALWVALLGVHLAIVDSKAVASLRPSSSAPPPFHSDFLAAATAAAVTQGTGLRKPIRRALKVHANLIQGGRKSRRKEEGDTNSWQWLMSKEGEEFEPMEEEEVEMEEEVDEEDDDGDAQANDLLSASAGAPLSSRNCKKFVLLVLDKLDSLVDQSATQMAAVKLTSTDLVVPPLVTRQASSHAKRLLQRALMSGNSEAMVPRGMHYREREQFKIAVQLFAPIVLSTLDKLQQQQQPKSQRTRKPNDTPSVV